MTNRIWPLQFSHLTRALVAGGALAGCVNFQTFAQLPAFPGAEGFGRFATGGRGGEVYHVTNLKDSGPGSLRDAVSRRNRTVVFEVGGVIPISERLVVAPNVTIAGQTAPGGGIAVYGNGISFSGANNSITRHIRFRMGVKGDAGRDAISIANGCEMIFDHVSVSWGRDENFSISGPVTNVTIQNCIIAQGLQPHSAGGLIQTGGGVSILRTLYIDNYTRNPKVKGVNQYVNNVVYNWGEGGCYILGDSASDSFANVMNNCFINGPNTGADAFIRGNTNFHLFAAHNFHDANRNGLFDGEILAQPDYGVVGWQEQPYDYPPLTMLSPVQAYQHVLARSGASLSRDPVDQRLINELLSLGGLGQIITNENHAPMSGPGQIIGGTAPVDSDRDGMPDLWENALGLNPQDARDRNHIAPGGYTQLEEYLNWLAGPHALIAAGRPLEVDLKHFAGLNREARFDITVGEHCTVTVLPEGTTARIIPEPGFLGRATFGFSIQGSDAPTNWFGLLCFKSGEKSP
ncbi:MAG: pectate lyase [Akkermansiaceae bacterium]|nr:pectate lyase [Verrucomicrobiales bacterium]